MGHFTHSFLIQTSTSIKTPHKLTPYICLFIYFFKGTQPEWILSNLYYLYIRFFKPNCLSRLSKAASTTYKTMVWFTHIHSLSSRSIQYNETKAYNPVMPHSLPHGLSWLLHMPCVFIHIHIKILSSVSNNHIIPNP